MGVEVWKLRSLKILSCLAERAAHQLYLVGFAAQVVKGEVTCRHSGATPRVHCTTHQLHLHLRLRLHLHRPACCAPHLAQPLSSLLVLFQSQAGIDHFNLAPHALRCSSREGRRRVRPHMCMPLGQRSAGAGQLDLGLHTFSCDKKQQGAQREQGPPAGSAPSPQLGGRGDAALVAEIAYASKSLVASQCKHGAGPAYLCPPRQRRP